MLEGGAALKKKTPSLMALSPRQKTRRRCGRPAAISASTAPTNWRRPRAGAAQATIFASGTEVGIAMAARALLQADGIAARVVSTPCWELFDRQDEGPTARP